MSEGLTSAQIRSGRLVSRDGLKVVYTKAIHLKISVRIPGSYVYPAATGCGLTGA